MLAENPMACREPDGVPGKVNPIKKSAVPVKIGAGQNRRECGQEFSAIGRAGQTEGGDAVGLLKKTTQEWKSKRGRAAGEPRWGEGIVAG